MTRLSMFLDAIGGELQAHGCDVKMRTRFGRIEMDAQVIIGKRTYHMTRFVHPSEIDSARDVGSLAKAYAKWMARELLETLKRVRAAH